MKWEQLFRTIARDVIWRVANINVARDATTGHRVPDYTITHEIKGVFEERGGQLLPLPAGFVQRGDAVLYCFDNVVPLDQIYMPENQRFYTVGYVYPMYEYLAHEDVTNFKYRVCDLFYRPYRLWDTGLEGGAGFWGFEDMYHGELGDEFEEGYERGYFGVA